MVRQLKRSACSVIAAVVVSFSLHVAMGAGAWAGCAQLEACHKVCEKYGAIGTPACEGGCAPAVQACARDKAEQQRRQRLSAPAPVVTQPQSEPEPQPPPVATLPQAHPQPEPEPQPEIRPEAQPAVARPDSPSDQKSSCFRIFSETGVVQQHCLDTALAPDRCTHLGTINRGTLEVYRCGSEVYHDRKVVRCQRERCVDVEY